MTVKNLKEVQIFDPDKFTKEVLFKESLSQAFILNFMPGQRLPSHGHPYTQVYLLVLEGSGTCHIDESVYEIHPHDVIHCQKDEKLSVENTRDEPLSIYVVLARETHIHSTH